MVEIPKNCKDDIKEAFNLFLPDKSQKVKPKYMAQIFEKIGLDKTQKCIYEMVKWMDTEENNLTGLTFDQFMAKVDEYFNDRSTREGLTHIFNLFDRSQTGYLSKADIRRISNESDLKLSSEMIDLLFQRAAVNGHEITLDDFDFFMKLETFKKD